MFIFTWYAFVFGLLDMQHVSSLVAETWMVSSFICLFVSIIVPCFVLLLHVLNSTHELLTNWNFITCIKHCHLRWQGGAFYVNGGSVSLTSCTVTGNTAVSSLIAETINMFIICLFDY